MPSLKTQESCSGLRTSSKEAADTVAEVAEQGDLKEIAVTVGEFVSGTLSLLLKHIKLIAAAVAGVTSAVLAFKAAAVITKVIASWQTAALQVKMLGTAQQFAAVKSAALNGQLTLPPNLSSGGIRLSAQKI